jgi:hypothetical protein
MSLIVKRFRRAPLTPFLVAAVLLHAATFGLWPWLRVKTGSQLAKPTSSAVETKPRVDDSIDIEWLPPLEAPGDDVPAPASPRPERDATLTRGSARPALALGDSELAGRPTSSSQRPAESSEDADSSSESATAAQSAVPVATPSPERPKLSLSQLGIGERNADAILPYLNVASADAAEQRLNRHLAQATLDRDRNRSNGIEGPITRALSTGAMALVAPDSVAKVAVLIGSDGRVADFRIVESNQDARLLQELGERVKAMLANAPVRVPNGRAVEFTYELTSEILLPSGRAPGLGVTVLGIPLKSGHSEKSSRISILEPKLSVESTSLPDPDRNGQVTQTPPQIAVGITLIGINADPVDLGAKARQVIHARLIRQRVL